MRERLRKHLATVVVAFVTASVAAGGTAFAIVANADRVDGYHANQLIRLGQSHINDNAWIGDGSNHRVRRVRITAPKKGFLFIVASSDIFGGSDTGAAECWLELDGTILESSERTWDLGADSTEENCSTDSAWPVGAGKHRVELWGDPPVGQRFDETTLEVLFVPFNAGGGVPVPIPPAAAGHGPSGN